MHRRSAAADRSLATESWEVSEWHTRYREGGKDALRQRKRGRREGEQRELSGALIGREFGVELSLPTISRYVARWGLTPQRPLKRALEQDPDVIRQWLNVTYPEIEVRAWVARHSNQIEIFHLPPYAPELNPDEYLNGDLKGCIHSGLPHTEQKGLKRALLSTLRSIQKTHAHVSSYFRHPKVRYAAA